MTTQPASSHDSFPGEQLQADRMPGHWLLARMGKRVLRPGGIELTRELLAQLNITTTDDVVEFAPGLGASAQLALESRPASYRGVERDAAAVEQVRRVVSPQGGSCVMGSAEATGLADTSASVVYGEAMLTMQGLGKKKQIMAEAFRLLKPGGRYGIHELALVPDDVPEAVKTDVLKSLSDSIRVGARPLTVAEWRECLETVGFEVDFQRLAPMHLLEPGRLVRDEGFWRALRFVARVLCNAEARQRVRRMRGMFRKHRDRLSAVAIVAHKPKS